VIDLAVVAVLVLAAWQGWRRGAVLMALGFAAFGAGYVGAALLFRPFGHYLSRTFSLSPIVALPLAATLILTVITGSIRVATFAVEQRRARARREGEPPSRLDCAGGAVLGALKGAAYAIILAWLVMTVHNLAHTGPDIAGTITGRAAAAVMQRATYAVTSRLTPDPLMATMLSVVATHPQEGVQAVNEIMRNRHVQGLLKSPALLDALAHGNVAALSHAPAVRSLAADRQFLAAAAQLGLAPGQPGGEALAQTLATQVAPLVRAAQVLRNDGEVQHLLESPEFRRAIDQGNVAALLRSQQFNRLTERLMAALRQDSTASR